MTKPKKQHYVPQFLLRNFAIGKKQKAKVWVLDKRNAAIFQASVRDIAHENMFYEYRGKAGTYELESELEKIDSKAAGIIQDVIASGRLPRSGEKSIWLSYYVIVQMLRTPVIRKDMDNFRALIINKFGREIAFEGDSKPIADYGPEDSKVSSLRLFSDVPTLAKHLQEKVWILAQAPNTAPYIISDNPVSKYNMLDRGPRGNLGLKNNGIELYMPLSPRLSLHVMCPQVATATLLTPELSKKYGDAMMDREPMHLQPENVDFVNSLQVIWAERFLYAKHREHLTMPLDMLRTNPELRDGTGVRQKPGEVKY